MGSRRSLVRIQSSRPCAPVAQLDRVSVFETEGYKFKSYQVHQISNNVRYLFLLSFLISCSMQDCRVGANASIQAKPEIQIDSKIADARPESKSIADQFRELRDNLQPGAQFKCNF